MITKHVYDSNTRELTDIEYYRDADGDLSSGATADGDTRWVSFTYDRLGRKIEVEENGGWSYEYDYDDDGDDSLLHLTDETMTITTNPTFAAHIGRKHQTTGDGQGRNTGFTAGTSLDATAR